MDFLVNQTLIIGDQSKFLIRHPRQLRQRIYILKRFKAIHKKVTCAHSNAELLHIADEILRTPLRGDIIECGVYKGGSTCKLSIVTKLTGKKLYACDSFKGLPKSSKMDEEHICINGTKEIYHEGDYSGTIDEVHQNLVNYGEPDVVELVPGWFQETLPRMSDKEFSLVFVDVDLYDSLTTCIENLWPSLQRGGKFFTHEAHHMFTIKAFTDKVFWKQKLGAAPPKFIGAGKGISRTKPCLGYLMKSK